MPVQGQLPLSAIRALERMLAAGVPLETALEVAKGFEADMADYAGAVARSLGMANLQATRDDERRQRDRERQAANRAARKAAKAEDVTPESVDCHTVALEDVTRTACDKSEEITPLSRPLSPQTPLSPTHTPPDITTREEAVSPAKRGTRLSETWEPTPHERQLAVNEGLNPEEIEYEARQFRNYWCSRSRDATKLNWTRTWQNRVADVGKRKREKLATRSKWAGGGGQATLGLIGQLARERGLLED